MKLLRMKPGHGEIVLAEGDVEIAEEERELIEAFRRELDAGMWAAVPIETTDGRREAEMVRSFAEVPRDAERVIFFPRAAGGAPGTVRDGAVGTHAARAGDRGARVGRARVGAEPGRRCARDVRARGRGPAWRANSHTPSDGASWTTIRAASAAPSSARARCCARA